MNKQNLRRTKLKYSIAKKIAFAGLGFWAVETIYFLIVYGWHISPINEAERLCDRIASILFTSSVILFIRVVVDIVEYVLENQKEESI